MTLVVSRITEERIWLQSDTDVNLVKQGFILALLLKMLVSLRKCRLLYTAVACDKAR